jgi:hypothetical protein
VSCITAIEHTRTSAAQAFLFSILKPLYHKLDYNYQPSSARRNTIPYSQTTNYYPQIGRMLGPEKNKVRKG